MKKQTVRLFFVGIICFLLGYSFSESTKTSEEHFNNIKLGSASILAFDIKENSQDYLVVINDEQSESIIETTPEPTPEPTIEPAPTYEPTPEPASPPPAAKTESSQSTSSSQSSGGSSKGQSANAGMVWIASSGSGARYHKRSNCSNMKNPQQVTLQEAIDAGYTPCKKCYR